MLNANIKKMMKNKQMDEVINFMSQFLDAEFDLTKSRFDIDLSDEEQEKKCYDTMSQFFHSIERLSINNYLRGKNDLTEESIVLYKKPEKIQKRPLFQIRKYENPKCGDVIKRVLTNNTIYLCYCGNDEIIGNNIPKYKRIFVIATSDEGLKIISRFFWKNGNLKKVGNYAPSHITKLGKKVTVKKFIAPEEESSLADYNKD